MGSHPIVTRRASVSRSRFWFVSIFAFHHSAFRFGHVACSGQPCQKHPSTNTASRSRGNTMSARRRTPERIERSTLNLSPRRCSSDRKASSGDVSRRRVTFMRRRTSAEEAAGTPDRRRSDGNVTSCVTDQACDLVATSHQFRMWECDVERGDVERRAAANNLMCSWCYCVRVDERSTCQAGCGAVGK